jgi:ELWxxDGT repeat protein
MGFTNLNNRLFFYAEDDAHGRELWTSDGTEAGTQVFKDINPEAGHGVCRPSPAIVMGGILYFEGNDGTTGCELWKSDGTPEGTVRVKDIVPGSVGSGAHSFVAVDGTLFFQASGPEHGWELWKSDGTDAGTVRVKDIMPGPDSSYIGSKADVGGVLFFAAHDGVSGQELWKSDGTEAGTVMVKEINPGPGPSVNIEVSYTPSAPGPAEAVLEILSNDIVSQRQVPLFGMGVSGELPPDEQIAAILALIEESVASGTLTGDGLGKSADGRLKALTNMIEAAGDLIEAGLLTEACVQLQDVYNRCDGESPPPDFVSGTAASELAAMVQALMASAGCE